MAILPLALRSTKFLRVLRILSTLFILVGISWLLILPYDDYSRRTYISENALLPGSVHTYFSGTEQSVFKAYRHEVEALGADADPDQIAAMIGEIFRGQGVKVGVQEYRYTAAGKEYKGKNVYAVLEAPRGDATESMVLAAGWKNMEEELNVSGVALVMALSRYFKRWSLWSKDVIFLITSDSRAGPQAWIDAYHDSHIPPAVSPLTLKSGAIQSVIVVDYPKTQGFSNLHVLYDGINGQLPNLDLFNTLVSIAEKQMDIPTTLHQMFNHNDGYNSRLQTMLRGMVNQALGHATGLHSSFIPYHIDAITIQATGDGYHNEESLGRLLESLFRSLNNLLEHFHQSFFFYLLLGTHRFVSIGTYLPAAMLLAGSFTLSAIRLWVRASPAPSSTENTPPRPLLLPGLFILTLHLLGFLPLYLFNTASSSSLTPLFIAFSIFSFLLPPLLSFALHRLLKPTPQQRTLISCFSLLLLGLFLSALATLNFSLSFLVSVFSAGFSAAHGDPMVVLDGSRRRGAVKTGVLMAGLQLVAPTMVLVGVARYWADQVAGILEEAAFGWGVWGMWTQVVVWGVWWPAWVGAGVGVCGWIWGDEEGVDEKENSEEKKVR